MSLPLAANTVDAAALADELIRFRVIDPARLAELLPGFSGNGGAALAEYLVARGALTAFQADQALAGHGALLVLGPYRLTGSAGTGTFGPLFSARHISKPGLFVARVLPLRSLWRAKQAKPLAHTLSAGIDHPAVVPLVEVDSANGFHYLVWTHAEGERLIDRVAASGSLHPGEAIALIGHLAGALGACHARGVVHGALTPHSVVLGRGGLPLVLELGAGVLLAQNIAEDESLFDSMSTAFASAEVLEFAAPELGDTAYDPTPAVDQYALGAVGYFALTGLSPYPHPTLADQLRVKRAGPPPSAAIVNPAVPKELAAIIERMMAPIPADRFATLNQVEETLAQLSVADQGSDSAQSAPSAADDPFKHTGGQGRYRAGGGNTKAIPGTAGFRPPERDDSEASITFELPETPESKPALIPMPTVPIHGPETESGWGIETLRDPPSGRRLERGESAPSAEGARPVADPRLTAPTPVQWHTLGTAEENLDPTHLEGPPPDSVLWKTVKRNLLFWQRPTETVQVSVFGPAAVAPGQSVKLAVFLHRPDAVASVRTLSRAFQHEAELIGAGFLTHEVPRGKELAVHLSVANAGVSRTLFACTWRGQPHRIGFDLHVPWESPGGPSPGLVSVGLNNVRIGKIEFRFNVLPRKA
jgi:hypothetical protein